MLKTINQVGLVLFFSLLFTSQVQAEKRIVKWVDSHGVTYYGDQLPTNAAGKSNQVINQQGVVVQRNNQVLAKEQDAQLKKEQLNQQRKDHVLLASYTTANEIDLARKRNLEMENAMITALSSQKTTVDDRLNRSIINAQAKIDKKEPVPADLKEEIRLAKSEYEKFENKINERKKALEKINQGYDAEKARFIALKQMQANY